MSGTIIKISVFLLLQLSALVSASGQDTARFRFFRLTAGGGVGHFINTFKNVPDVDVNNNRPSLSAKLLWQPEYRLRVGLESGYYWVYTTHRIQTGNTSQHLNTDLDVVPLFISFSMAVFRHVELNLGSGWASMIYRVHSEGTPKNEIIGHVYSFSNYTAGIAYLFPLTQDMDLNAEIKYFYFGKTNDHHTTALLTFSYKIARWKIKRQ